MAARIKLCVLFVKAQVVQAAPSLLSPRYQAVPVVALHLDTVPAGLRISHAHDVLAYSVKTMRDVGPGALLLKAVLELV